MSWSVGATFRKHLIDRYNSSKSSPVVPKSTKKTHPNMCSFIGWARKMKEIILRANCVLLTRIPVLDTHHASSSSTPQPPHQNPYSLFLSSLLQQPHLVPLPHNPFTSSSACLNRMRAKRPPQSTNNNNNLQLQPPTLHSSPRDHTSFVKRCMPGHTKSLAWPMMRLPRV